MTSHLARSLHVAFTDAPATKVLTTTTTKNIPAAIVAAVLPLGLPPSSLPTFIPTLLAKNKAGTPVILGAAVGGVQKGLAQSFRVLWLALVPFAVLGAVATCFLQKEVTMTSHIDISLFPLRY